MPSGMQRASVVQTCALGIRRTTSWCRSVGVFAVPEVGSVIGGKYRVDAILGMGGMGAVYGVTHEITGKQFAIKWLLPELVESEEAAQRFLREAQIAGGIEHPNVLSIFDVGKEGDAPYIVMERLNGEPLGSRLERGAMSPAEACSVLISVASGVAAAHAHGIIHRDLKPDNIFLAIEAHTGTVRPKVLDFGISKPKKDHPILEGNLTTTGMVVGTPRYMSPEHVRGSKDVDHRTDIYALGVILYEMLTLRAPFESDTYGDLVLRIATETPEPITAHDPKLPHALNDVVMKAMARDPAARFPTAEDFAAALSPWAQGTQAAVNSAFAPTAAFPTPPGLERAHAGDAEGSADARLPGVGSTGSQSAPAATPTSWEQPLPMRRSLLTIGSLAGTAIVATAAFAIWVFLIREDPSHTTQGASMASAASNAAAAEQTTASASDEASAGESPQGDSPVGTSRHDAGLRQERVEASEKLPSGAATPEVEREEKRASERAEQARSRRSQARERAETARHRRAKRRAHAQSSRATRERRSESAPERSSQQDRAREEKQEEARDIRHRAGELSLDDF